MNRIPIIAGNWKMNLDITGAVTLATTLQKNLDTQATMLPPCEIIVAPPSLAVHAVLDVHWEDNGAFTGKLSHESFYRPTARGFERDMQKRLKYFNKLRTVRTTQPPHKPKPHGGPQ